MSVVRVDFFFYGTTHMFKILHWRTSSKEIGNNLDDLSTYTLLTAKEFEHRLRGLTRYLATRAARAHAFRTSISLFSDARFQACSLLSQRREFQQKTDSAKALGSRVETTLHTKNKSQRA